MPRSPQGGEIQDSPTRGKPEKPVTIVWGKELTEVGQVPCNLMELCSLVVEPQMNRILFRVVECRKEETVSLHGKSTSVPVRIIIGGGWISCRDCGQALFGSSDSQ